MSFEKGDRVKVITKNSMHTGKEGTITSVFFDGDTVLVQLDDDNHSGFFVSELEPAKGTPTVHVEVDVNAEDGYTVALDLTSEEARGVEKFVAAAQEAERRTQFAPGLEFRKVK